MRLVVQAGVNKVIGHLAAAGRALQTQRMRLRLSTIRLALEPIPPTHIQHVEQNCIRQAVERALKSTSTKKEALGCSAKGVDCQSEDAAGKNYTGVDPKHMHRNAWGSIGIPGNLEAGQPFCNSFLFR